MPFKDKDAKRAYDREWFRRQRQTNPVYRNKRREVNKLHARRMAAWLVKLKQGLACIHCGESHPACIDFHHRDPRTKLFNISSAPGIRSKAKVLDEIKKCDPVCANCHRKLHWKARIGSDVAA